MVITSIPPLRFEPFRLDHGIDTNFMSSEKGVKINRGMAKYETNSVFSIRSHQSAESNIYNVFTGYKERTIG